MAVKDPVAEKNIQAWLSGPFDEKTKNEIRELLEKKPEEAINAFYKNLSFGTGGIRGLMGVGTNRLNPYTIQMITQGLANYLNQTNRDHSPLTVLIGYDSRHHSKEFAEVAAKVLAGNDIQVYVFANIRPTPLVSYGCRFKHCSAAIMITASHNPHDYNGFKVYWKDGGQVLPPHDIGIVEAVNQIRSITDVKSTPSIHSTLINWVEEEIDKNYLKDSLSLLFYPEANLKDGKKLNIVYTSLHGTGITILPKMFQEAGFTSLSFVDSQIIPDGNFPTAPYPNPEEKEALKLGIEKLIETNSDLLIATDPDADRVGVVCLHGDKPFIFTGNQIICICLEHICKALENSEKMNQKVGFIKTVVTTELFAAIAAHYGATYRDVLTGFKYIAQIIEEWKEDPTGPQYLFGGEESYGYLLGTFARDKDAIISSALIAEVALQAKLQGKTLVDKLYDLYDTYGIYEEKVLSVNFEETKAGKEAMTSAMQKLRSNPFDEIDSYKIVAIEDYQTGIKHELSTNRKTALTLPPSDVLIYRLQGGSKLMVRPSGTEPKIKIYCGLILKEFTDREAGERKVAKRADELLNAVKSMLVNG